MADTKLIQGRYQLLDRLGRGGMGAVWRARDEALGRHVAVKCLDPLGPRHDESALRVLRARFRREARVAAGLQHRGVTVVHDFGEHDGVLFLVMELLDGHNLAELLKHNGRRPLGVGEVMEIAEQVAAALAYTHRQGIVHRDLKPANVMRLADGTVKICDFGIARPGEDPESSRLTGVGITMGTPQYMSPEQIAGGESVDHRSDLYSFGCVLYEIATGSPPFAVGDAWAVLLAHRDTTPEPPRSHRPELPEAFERIILDLLAKDPADRPRDAADLTERVRAVRSASPAFPQPERPAGEAPGPPSRLPQWTRGMSAGAGAEATRAHPAPTADHWAGLTGMWTGHAATPSPPEGSLSPDASPAERQEAALRLSRAGRWEEAGEILHAVLAEREETLGANHPRTLAARHEIAFILSRTGRPADALRAYEHVAQARARALGEDHPHTLAARQEAAYELGRLGRWADALAGYRRVAQARHRVLGPGHPDTLASRDGESNCLEQMGRSAEAVALRRQVAAVRRQGAAS